MMWLKNLAETLVFRIAALRALAAGRAVTAGIVCHVAGYLAYALARGFVYASLPEFSSVYGRSGLLSVRLGIELASDLIFLLFLFIPAIVALSNAFSDDGHGLSFSVAKYRAHLSVLFPVWGVICLVTAPLQLPLPHFLVIGDIIEISLTYLLRALLLGIYTFWAVMRLNYLSPTRTFGVFAISALTVPIFFFVLIFVRKLYEEL